MNCNLTTTFASVQGTVDVVLLVLSSVAAILNVCIVHLALRIFAHRSRDTIHIYIVSMTLGDLVLVVCLSLESLDRILQNPPVLANKYSLRFSLNFLSWLGWAVSGLSLVLLNSDKLLYFCFPLHYRLVKSVRRAVVLSCSVWAIASCFIAYLWLASVVELVPLKQQDGTILLWALNIKRPWYYTLFTFLFAVVPIGSSLLVSCYLSRLMRLKRVGMEEEETRRRKSTLSNSSRHSQSTVAPAFSHKLRSLVFIFTTTAWTAFSLLPYRVFVTVKLHYVLPNLGALKHNCEVLTLLAQTAWVLHYLLMLNPVVNPFITAFIYHPYRIALLEWVRAKKTAKMSPTHL